MSLKKIGEKGLIDYFKKGLQLDKSVFRGIGDDTAVIKSGFNKYLLVTSDMLIEGTHFRKTDLPGFIGRKAISVSVSDIVSMGGKPFYATISLGLPLGLNPGYVFDLWDGIKSQAKKYKISIIGGDTVKSKNVTLDINMIGEVSRKHLVLREGARKGDVIFVSGYLGGSIYGRHLKFEPRIEQSQFLVKNYKPSAMIDISDGLINDLNHILEASNVGAYVFSQLIPIHKNASNINEALFMGEDFELLFTLKPKDAYRLMKSKAHKFFPIGEITDKKKKLEIFDKHMNEIKIKKTGFKHF